jgi:hypothetical protein
MNRRVYWSSLVGPCHGHTHCINAITSTTASMIQPGIASCDRRKVPIRTSTKGTAAMPTVVKVAGVILTMCGVGGVVLRSRTTRPKLGSTLPRKRSAMKSAKAHRAHIQPLCSVCFILCEVAQRGRSATGASHRRRPQRHSACRLAPVRWTVWFASLWSECSRKKPRPSKRWLTPTSVIVVSFSLIGCPDMARVVHMSGDDHLLWDLGCWV